MFQIGETVQLKSGGPFMTVESGAEAMGTGGVLKVWCQWFARNQVERAPFPIASLERVQQTGFGFSQVDVVMD